MIKPLYILKLGGSVVTYKDRKGGRIRKALLERIAKNIKLSLGKRNFNLVLIHGAGSVGHQLAREYNLDKGANKTKNGFKGSLISRIANQKMDVEIAEIFVKSGLPVTSVHTSSVIVQKNKKIKKFTLDAIDEALKRGSVPMLYGEMVFDKDLGMTICSGDVIVPYLANKLNAKKLLFASDIDGIFDKDPHVFKDAKLLRNIDLRNIQKISKLTDSHNIDTTGGLAGKVESIKKLRNAKVKTVKIFNGLEEKNYLKILTEKDFLHSTLYL